eukprot:15482815-Alexandrium_andersonii.AAC.1
MRNCLMRSKLELRDPWRGLKLDPRWSGGVPSAPLSAQMPNPPTKRAGRRAEGASRKCLGVGAPPGRLMISIVFI